MCTSLGACSARFSPAPVETLSTRTASKNNLTEITGDSYIVQAGDTLFAIAFYSGNTYRELARINNISAPYAIQVGQKINLKAAPSKVIVHKEIDAGQSVPRSTTVVVDPPPTQRYGRINTKTPQENLDKTVAAVTQSDSNRWIWPATGARRVATVGSDGSNRGLDITGRLGSKIIAAKSGKVVYAGNALKGYGNLIIIKHDEEYLSAYAHNDQILVSEQAYVEQGQQIATMGQSGASEVMLHFEIRKRGKSRDPFLYLLKD